MLGSMLRGSAITSRLTLCTLRTGLQQTHHHCSTLVTAADAEAYQRDGAVLIKNLLSADEVECLREAIDWNVANPGPLGAIASQDDDPGSFFEDFCNWQRVPGYQRVIFGSSLPAAAATLMGSETVRLYHDHLLVKQANTRQPTPFHQDQPYYNIEGNQNVSFWIPVDPVPREASLDFVRGSHRDGKWYMPRTFQTEQAKWFPEGTLADAPKPEDIGSDQMLGWALEPGDALAFHMLTMHGSQGSTSLRRAFSVRVLGDDIVHAPRQWRTSPQFDGVAEELAEGVAMEHELFPLLHPKSAA